MGKNLIFCIEKQKFEASITKIDRDKVYGFVEEKVFDKNGNECISGNLLDDGKTLILSGSTALKTVDENFKELDKKKLKTVYLDGKDAILIQSSYDGEIKLKKVELEHLFNLEVNTVYQLKFDSPASKTEMLKATENSTIYSFVFNYRADFEGADAIVLSSQNELFILTGRALQFDFLENKVTIPAEESVTSESEEEETTVDFGML